VTLSNDARASATAKAARHIVSKTPGLRPTHSGALAQTLEGPLPEGGPDGPTLAAANRALAASEAAFQEFKSRLAGAELQKARRLLFSLTPSPTTNKLLARVSFRLGLMHLRANNMGLATSEFVLQYRLDPDSKIDSLRFPPSVVRAFEQARARATPQTSASISVTATYDDASVFLDGRKLGTVPLELSVTPGAHVLAISAPQYQPAAQTLELDPGDRQDLRFDLQPRSRVSQALALRFAAQKDHYSDASVRMAAARVARLVGSDSVLVIVGASGQAALYVQTLDRLSFRSNVESSLGQALALVLPAARPTLIDGPARSVKTPWYRNPIGIVALATGLSLSVVGVLTLGTGNGSMPERRGTAIWDF